jgi:hypothetical protein
MAELYLDENFSELEIGLISSGVGAHTEYHYLPEAGPHGNWTVACFASGKEAGEAWQIQRRGRAHVMVITGDHLWRDYTVTVRFRPLAKGHVGVAFRYRNSRCHYFFGLTATGVVLK